MAAQTWNSLKVMLLATLVKTQAPYNVSPPDFDALFPQATSYAEARICRDIVFLNQRQQNATLSTIAGSRTISLGPIAAANGYGPLVVVEGLALIMPATSTAQAARVPFDASSLDVIDQVWPAEAITLPPSLAPIAPQYWGMLDDSTIVICPTPDAPYTVAITGLFQPPPISSANQSTYISSVYPDLLEAACMVWLTGALLHNFGSQADDPRSAMSWERTYTTLLMSAKSEEARRRGLAPDRAAPVGAPA